MSTSTAAASPRNWPTKQYTPRHPTWPYTAQDFHRHDPTHDTHFYSSPRFVTHIDDAAIASLQAYYDSVLPRHPGTRILDFCSSWLSHFPPALETAVMRGDVHVTGLGMNRKELDRNSMLDHRRIVRDLNLEPDVRRAVGVDPDGTSPLFDAATNVVSIEYLIEPVTVLRSLLEVMRPGGTVHLVISDRCFPTKAIARWLRVEQREKLEMVGDFLHFAAWKGIEIVELSDGTVGDEGGGGGGDGLQQGLMKMMGMGMYGRRDPLWVVRGIKEG